MKLLRSNLSAVVSAAATIFAVQSILFGLMLLSIPSTVENGKEIEMSFLAATTFVDNFQHTNGHIPSNAEFNEWKSHQPSAVYGVQNIELTKPTAIPEDIARKFGVPPADSYALSLWRGEWYEYYASWAHASTIDSPQELYANFVALCLAFAIIECRPLVCGT